MEEVVGILHSKPDSPEDIIAACELATRVLKDQQSHGLPIASRINQADMGNCFMAVLLSYTSNRKLLSSVTDTIVELLNAYPELKTQYGNKGLYFNIMDFVQIYRDIACLNDESLTYLQCSLKLTIAISDNCPDNFVHCMNAGVMAMVPFALKVSLKNEDVLLLTLKLLHLLIGTQDTNDSDKNISKCKSLCLNQCLVDKVDNIPISSCVLTGMNSFLGQCSEIQLYGIKCLQSFCPMEHKMLLENGVIDTLVHASGHYSDVTEIQFETVKFVSMLVCYSEFQVLSNKIEDICYLFSTILKRSNVCNATIMDICSTIKVFLMQTTSFGIIGKSKIHTQLFATLLRKYKNFPLNENDKKAFMLLQHCLYLFVAYSPANFRNTALLHACETGSINETLFFLLLGANINAVSLSNKTPLLIACDRHDISLVKALICTITTMQQCGFWNARIEDVSQCIKYCLMENIDEIVPILLWYLMYRDQNGVVEWNALELSHIKPPWMRVIFSSLAEECVSRKKMQFGNAGIQLADMLSDLNIVDVLGSDHDDDEDLHTQFSFLTEYRSPIKLLKEFFDESSNLNDLSSIAQQTFRDSLFLSYDGEMISEMVQETDMQRSVDNIPFPPATVATVDIQEINMQNNNLSTLDSFLSLNRKAVEILCKTVIRINLSTNGLSQIPCGWPQIFKNLEELILTNNYLTTFPLEVIQVCSKLKSLDLSANSLTDDGLVFKGEQQFSLPKHMCLLTLKLSNNNLTSFPFWTCSMDRLRNLDISGNNLKSVCLPDEKSTINEAVQFPELLQLKLQQNQIEKFDSSVLLAMPRMHHLNLASNKLTDLQMDLSVKQTGPLQYLDLANNALSKFPDMMSNLSRMQTLNLSGNKLSSFPESCSWKPKRLIWLDLSKNLFKDISSLGERLCLFSCNTLRVFNVSHNKIQSLPPELGNLKCLEILDVSQNKLHTLPNELGRLSNLKNLGIEGNKLSFHTSVLEGKTQEICAFLYGRLKKSVPHNRVKLMLLGHPEAGKTTLLQSLVKYKGRSRRFSEGIIPKLLEKSETKDTILATVGVDVTEWTLKHKNRSFQVSAWDFAGQEDFYATHPCFLSERAMYLVVYDGSKGPHQLATLKPWLTAIHARAAHCPVLIIASHADVISSDHRDELFSVLDKELKSLSKNKWFPNTRTTPHVLHEFLDVREGSSNISYLRSKLADILNESVIQGNPLVGGMVPFSYVQLENMLRKEAAKKNEFPVINFSELACLVQDCGTAYKPLFENGSELMLAVKYLHQTGVLLHFDDPRSSLYNKFFIEPSWLCQLIAQVISIEEHRNYKLNPYISPEHISKNLMIENLLSNEGFTSAVPEDFIPSLFQLLENFEVILQQDDDTYLVPSKLPLEKPELPGLTQCLLLRYLSMAYVPMGFWPRLIARLLSFSSQILKQHSKIKYRPNKPETIRTWRQGIFMEWKCENEATFLLLQHGNKMYKEAMQTTREVTDNCEEDFEFVSWSHIKDEGLEIALPRSKNSIVILGQVVDHINNLVEEWYPGLLHQDLTGSPFFSHHSPCLKCIDQTTSDKSKHVHSFCINQVADSVLHHATSSKKFRDLVDAGYQVETTKDGEIFVECPNHPNDPISTSSFAPEINFDDFEADLRIHPDHLQFERTPQHLLGDGGFGSVYHALYKEKDVAIKTFHISAPDSLVRMFRAELNILAKHQHPSIISFIGFVPPGYLNQTFHLPMLAMEFARLGALGSLLVKMFKMTAKKRMQELLPLVRHRIVYEIVDGLSFLHSQHIVYRDLKPDNVLLLSLEPTSATISKITDYGISTLVSPGGVPSPSGSPGYSAPEVVSIKTGGKHRSQDLFPYSFKCDIYSFGLMLHEIAVGRSPWIDYVNEEQNTESELSLSSSHPDDIVLKGIKPSLVSSYEGALPWPHAQKLIDRCLQRNPDNRPTSKQLVEVLASIDSCCIRMQEYLNSSPIGFCMCLYSHFSEMASKEDLANPNASLIWLPNSTSDTNQLVNSTINLETCKFGNQSHFCEFRNFTISGIVCLVGGHPNNTSANETYIVGTTEGEILCCTNDHVEVLFALETGVTCITLHSPPDAPQSRFIVAGLENATIIVFETSEKHNGKLCQMKKLQLNEIACSQPITTMESFGCKLHVGCGKFIISLNLIDSGGPTICSVKTISVETKSSQIRHLAVSQSSLYVVCNESSVVKFWLSGSAQRNRLDVASFVPDAKGKTFVTSMFVDRQHSTLWVGLNSGHVVVVREPLHSHVVRSDSKPAAVLQTHADSVLHILSAPDAPDRTTGPLILCVGTGKAPLLPQLVSHDGQRKRSSSFMHLDGTFVVAVDADIADKADLLASAICSRSSLNSN